MPGFDVTAFWARAGVGHMTAPKGTEPFMLRSGIGDHTTSLATVSAILAALYERERTGDGRLVQTSLLATGVYAVGSDLAVQLTFGRVASIRAARQPDQSARQLLQEPRRPLVRAQPARRSGGLADASAGRRPAGPGQRRALRHRQGAPRQRPRPWSPSWTPPSPP